ncbi:unnamed protein product [Calypogeia fissa]
MGLSGPMGYTFAQANKTFGFWGLKRATGLRRVVHLIDFENTHAASTRGSRRASVFHKMACSTNVVTSRLQIDLVPCLVDNYAYLLHDTSAKVTAVVDPSAAGPVINALKDKGLSLDFILNTHHHWDHTGGNLDLKREYNAQVVGPRADEDRIPGIDISLRDGESWTLGDNVMHVLDTPGHTRGHVSFYFPDSSAVFTGDTLFAMGCGRLFEGSPEQMWNSLTKLLQLPDDTLIYCGHEYTLSNGKFARSMEPQNQALLSYFEKVAELRQKGIPTIPTSLADEKKFNPFLRPFSEELRKSLNLKGSATDVEAFAAVRAAKDRF